MVVSQHSLRRTDLFLHSFGRDFLLLYSNLHHLFRLRHRLPSSPARPPPPSECSRRPPHPPRRDGSPHRPGSSFVGSSGLRIRKGDLHGTDLGLGVAIPVASLVRSLASLGKRNQAYAYSPRWTASSHITRLPLSTILPPIVIPTLYLWICDALALRRGTWVISTGTKFGVSAYGLEIE